MKSEQEFLEKFRLYVIGGFLCGSISERKDGPLVRASKSDDIPEVVDKLLLAMHRFLNDKPFATLIPPPPPSRAQAPEVGWDGKNRNGATTK
jgi:hypothetical protein